MRGVSCCRGRLVCAVVPLRVLCFSLGIVVPVNERCIRPMYECFSYGCFLLTGVCGFQTRQTIAVVYIRMNVINLDKFCQDFCTL